MERHAPVVNFTEALDIFQDQPERQEMNLKSIRRQTSEESR